MITPELHRKRSWAGRIGSAVQRSRHDPLAYTAAGRSAFLRRFWPDDPTLTAEEAQRRAEAGLRAHMLKLSARSAKSRAARKQRPGKVARK